MGRAELVARAQARTEAVNLTDACTIRRRTGETNDPFSGAITPTWAALYSGKCRVQQSLAQADQHDAGEDYQLQLRLILQLPMPVTGLEVGDEVTMTVSQDPDLVGRVFLIRDLFHKTDASARRVGITERTD